MGLEMVESLGKSKPSLPEHFMGPEDEERLYTIFRALIGDKAAYYRKGRKD